MKKKINILFQKENGQAAIWFSVTLVVMLSVAALVIDYGRPALVGRRLQNAADSAALAASQVLPVSTGGNTSEIRSVACEYAAENGFGDNTVVNVELSKPDQGHYMKVEVAIDATVEYTFAKIFGDENINMRRSAAVELVSLSGVKNAVPLSVKQNELDQRIAEGNYEMTLKYGGGSGDNGAYGAVDLDGENSGGANDYSQRVKYGYEGIIYIGDILPTENGNMSGPTVTAVEYRLSQCHHSPRCTPEHYVEGCPRIMIVPVVTYIDKHQVRVEGFAPFILQGVDGSGNECNVHGSYIPGLVVQGETGASANHYGTYGRKLVK